jgi:hypothetical protein
MVQRVEHLLLSDPGLARKRQPRGKARVRHEYIWEEVAKAPEAIYLAVVNAPQKKPAAQKKAAGKAAKT